MGGLITSCLIFTRFTSSFLLVFLTSVQRGRESSKASPFSIKEQMILVSSSQRQNGIYFFCVHESKGQDDRKVCLGFFVLCILACKCGPVNALQMCTHQQSTSAHMLNKYVKRSNMLNPKGIYQKTNLLNFGLTQTFF